MYSVIICTVGQNMCLLSDEYQNCLWSAYCDNGFYNYYQTGQKKWANFVTSVRESFGKCM